MCVSGPVQHRVWTVSTTGRWSRCSRPNRDHGQCMPCLRFAFAAFLCLALAPSVCELWSDFLLCRDDCLVRGGKQVLDAGHGRGARASDGSPSPAFCFLLSFSAQNTVSSLRLSFL